MQKELQAQIKQWLSKLGADWCRHAEIAYHFTDTPKVKTLYVTEALRDQLAKVIGDCESRIGLRAGE